MLQGRASQGPRALCSPLRMCCFPGASVVKNLPANAGDVGLIPGSGRSPGEGEDNPLPCACLQRSLVGYTHGVGKSWTRLRLNNSMCVLKNVPQTHWPPLPLPLPCVTHVLFHHRWPSTWTCSHVPAPVSARSWYQEPRAPSYAPITGAVRCPVHAGRGAVTRATRAESPSQGNDLS